MPEIPRYINTQTDFGIYVPDSYKKPEVKEPSISNIVLFGSLEDENVAQVLTSLVEANSDPTVDEILLTMGTDGGSLYNAIALYDQIRHSKKPVDILATGECGSAGVLVLQAARTRMSDPNTQFMVHPVSSNPGFLSMGEMVPTTEELVKTERRYWELYLEKCGMSYEDFQKHITPSRLRFYLTPEQARKFGPHGLIDTILEHTDELPK